MQKRALFPTFPEPGDLTRSSTGESYPLLLQCLRSDEHAREGHKWEAEAGMPAWATKEEPISKREARKKQSPGGQLRRCEALQWCALPRTLLRRDLIDRRA